jgi:hypothetical protein
MNRRWSHPEFGAAGQQSFDWDSAMSSAAQHESVEVLRHQLEVERESRARVQRGEALFALGLVATAFGFSFGVGALSVRKK